MGAGKQTNDRASRRQGKQSPPAALVRPAPGERTISNAEVPLPRSPLSLAGGTAHRKPLHVVLAANRGFSPRGCKGRSPLHEKTLGLPLPAGKGGGGIGAGNKAKGRVCRRQGRHAPAGHHSDKVYKCRKRFSAGVPGAKPPAKKTKNIPPSRREGGQGGWGQEIKLKAG